MIETDIKSILLAGGSGSRLWPLSNNNKPKQLLSFFNDKHSLLQKSFLRLSSICETKNILTVTNISQLDETKRQLSDINSDLIVSEPCSRNTAPAIFCGLKYFIDNGTKENTVVIVSPSDHYISNTNLFKTSITNAIQLALDGYLVTLGIKPDYPETGYGYIETDCALTAGYKVKQFVEKPDFDRAVQYIKTGNYFWNSGIFIGKLSTFLNELKEHSKDIYSLLTDINFKSTNNLSFETYSKFPSISIDYAIAEKSDNIALVELESDWSDLGSWKSVYCLSEKDADGNAIYGNAILHNVTNSLIFSPKETCLLSSMNNVIAINVNGKSVIMPMDKSQDTKILYQQYLQTYTGEF